MSSDRDPPPPYAVGPSAPLLEDKHGLPLAGGTQRQSQVTGQSPTSLTADMDRTPHRKTKKGHIFDTEEDDPDEGPSHRRQPIHHPKEKNTGPVGERKTSRTPSLDTTDASVSQRHKPSPTHHTPQTAKWLESSHKTAKATTKASSTSPGRSVHQLIAKYNGDVQGRGSTLGSRRHPIFPTLPSTSETMQKILRWSGEKPHKKMSQQCHHHPNLQHQHHPAIHSPSSHQTIGSRTHTQLNGH